MFGFFLLFGAFVAVATAAYVHVTCMSRLGPNREDNSVRLFPANNSSANAKAQPLQPPVLAVILGWGGSTSKQLRRLVAYFNDVLQCPALTYINPMSGFLHNTLDDTYIVELLGEIQKQVTFSAPGAPSGFVLYVHSNNGAFVFVELKKHLQDPASPFYPLRTHLRAVVFDSAPALYEEYPTHSALGPLAPVVTAVQQAMGWSTPCVAIVLGRPQYVHPFWTPAITLWIIAYRATVLLWARLTSSDGAGVASKAVWPRERLAEGLQKNVFVVPQLFLYSSGDRLLEARYVEAYVYSLRAPTQQPPLPLIQAHDFKSTGHVQHFLRQPEEYTQQLRQFLQQVQQAATVKSTVSNAQRL